MTTQPTAPTITAPRSDNQGTSLRYETDGTTDHGSSNDGRTGTGGNDGTGGQDAGDGDNDDGVNLLYACGHA